MLKRLENNFLNLHPGIRFVIKALIMILIWKVVYVYIIYPHTSLNFWLTNLVGNTSATFLNWLGHHSEFDHGRYIVINGVKSVIVDHSCNGLELLALFLGFMVLTNGAVIKRVVFSLLGLVIVYIINALRVMLLGLNFIYYPNSFEFNHKYLYLGVVYLVILGLWLIWTDVIRGKKMNIG